jgi:hypothetical protein
MDSAVTKTLLAVGLFLFLVIGGIGSCAVGINNNCVRQEAGIRAQYEQDQNNFDNFTKAIREAAQVPDMYADDLLKVARGAIGARYGAEGSKALFQFIKESNPNVDASVYTKIQQLIEAGHSNFEANQKMLLDKKRVYEVTLGEFPGGSIAHFLGFPRMDLTKYGIVTSDETQKAFETKKAEPLKLR